MSNLYHVHQQVQGLYLDCCVGFKGQNDVLFLKTELGTSEGDEEEGNHIQHIKFFFYFPIQSRNLPLEHQAKNEKMENEGKTTNWD